MPGAGDDLSRWRRADRWHMPIEPAHRVRPWAWSAGAMPTSRGSRLTPWAASGADGRGWVWPRRR